MTPPTPVPQAIVRGVVGYLIAHPEELLRAAKNALSLRFGLPLDAFRWFTDHFGAGAARDVQLEAVPPGIRLGATLELMGSTIRASAVVFVDGVAVDAEQIRFEVRLEDVSLKVLDDSETPVATLIRSGALDLSRPGNLVAYMPKRPKFLVEAEDDRVVIDVMKHPVFANQRVETVLGLLTPFVTLSGIQTDWEHLDIKFTALREGIRGAWSSVRERLG